MKKLLIKNTQFFGGMNADYLLKTDILISVGVIERIAPSIEAEDEWEIFDASGSFSSQGFIDSHVHVAVPGMTQYKGMEMGVDIVKYGIQSGVATLTDAGTFGANSIKNAVDYARKVETTQVFFFMNASKTGIQPGTAELENVDDIDIPAALDAYAQNKDRIVGIKARASVSASGSAGIKAIAKAKELAVKLGLPMFVHIGNEPPCITEVLNLLARGDAITHCFHGKLSNAIVNEDYSLRPETIQARERGVLFDVGHGSESFDYEVARRCFLQGFLPDMISTDLHSLNCFGPVYSLPVTVSKMLSLDEDITRWIPKVTVNPGRAFHLGITDGNFMDKPANLVIFNIIPTDETQFDSYKNPIHLKKKMHVQAVIRGDHIIEMK